MKYPICYGRVFNYSCANQTIKPLVKNVLKLLLKFHFDDQWIVIFTHIICYFLK